MSNRNQSLQVLRFIAASVVIATHYTTSISSWLAHEQTEGSVWQIEWIHRFGHCGVDVFFVLSGFIIAYISAGQSSKAGFVREFLVRRAIRIYPIYWILTFPAIAVLVLKNLLSNRMYVGDSLALDIAWIVGSFLLIPIEKPDGTLGPVLGPGWTLIFEVYFYLTFALASLQKSVNPVLFLTVVFIFFVICGQVIDIDSIVWDTYTHPLLLEFLAGCLLAQKFVRKEMHLVCAVSMIAISILFLLMFGPNALVDGKTTDARVIYFGIPSFFLVYGFLGLESHLALRWPRWMVALGDSSYSAYLSHTVVTIKAFGFVVMQLGLLGRVPAGVLLVLLLGFALAIGHLIYLFIEKPLLERSKKVLTQWGRDRATYPNDVRSD